MGIVYEINRDLGTTVVLWGGMIGETAFLTHAHALCSDPLWPTPERLHLSDLRYVSLDSSMDNEVLEKGAAIYGSQRQKIIGMKVAILSETEFERAVKFERILMRYAASAIVFHSADVACTWLGLNDEKVRTVLKRLRSLSDLTL
ncbi:MAG TPA: hypothetical protein VMJ64_01790 [Anaerolineales bacterium]|nr:hypothetical protein [Anaerolineales bacterium]